MKLRNTIKTLGVVAGLALAAGSANAATVQLRFDDFEDAGTVVASPPSDWQDDGNSNARGDQAGSDGLGGSAGKGVRVRSSTGEMFLGTALQLATGDGGSAFASLTISFDIRPDDAGYNTRLQYSALGDFTDVVELVNINGGDAPYTVGAWLVNDSHTITDGVGGYVFTDTANLRFFSDGGGANSTFNVFDNVLITAEQIPEPSTTALLGLGGLALIMRRRK
tara:strand:+ start:38 stop:703 length:666 start_codon:yes stop_codon:yes gene_type:complete